MIDLQYIQYGILAGSFVYTIFKTKHMMKRKEKNTALKAIVYVMFYEPFIIHDFTKFSIKKLKQLL